MPQLQRSKSKRGPTTREYKVRPERKDGLTCPKTSQFGHPNRLGSNPSPSPQSSGSSPFRGKTVLLLTGLGQHSLLDPFRSEEWCLVWPGKTYQSARHSGGYGVHLQLQAEGVLLAAHRPDIEKVTAYECGLSPIYGMIIFRWSANQEPNHSSAVRVAGVVRVMLLSTMFGTPAKRGTIDPADSWACG
jgi:hypothetical protein